MRDNEFRKTDGGDAGGRGGGVSGQFLFVWF